MKHMQGVTAILISCLSECGLGITSSASRQFHHWLHTPSKCCRLLLPWQLICDSWRGREATKSVYMCVCVCVCVCVRCRGPRSMRESRTRTHTLLLCSQTVACLWDVCHKALDEVKGWSQGQHGFHTLPKTPTHTDFSALALAQPPLTDQTPAVASEREDRRYGRCGVSCLLQPQHYKEVKWLSPIAQNKGKAQCL